MSESIDLTGKLLVAMPGMGDPRFDKSVVYICAHSAEGAMGLIVNKPTEDIRFVDLLEQLSIKPKINDASAIRVHFGGPVENGRGFVLHSSDYGDNASTLQVDDHVGMTATLEILEDIAAGQGPSSSIMTLGYSGWGPGQLEDEIARNGWLTCQAPLDVIFSDDNDAKWTAALAEMGVDPLLLSSQAGHA